MNITDLPSDVFLLIIVHFSPAELIRSRRVSKSFHAAFTESGLCHQLLLQHYPRARELRVNATEEQANWADKFQKVAARYHHLKAGSPRSIETLAVGKSFVVPKWATFYPVATWQQHLQFEEKTALFHYPDTLWTYDEGILIFPSAEMQQYALYDLEAGTMVGIDIGPENKVVRRIRLKEKVLIVEWCEQDAYHQLNENEIVHRHFASAYNIFQEPPTKQWKAVFRSVPHPRNHQAPADN
jgi:hypothetical protein